MMPIPTLKLLGITPNKTTEPTEWAIAEAEPRAIASGSKNELPNKHCTRQSFQNTVGGSLADPFGRGSVCWRSLCELIHSSGPPGLQALGYRQTLVDETWRIRKSTPGRGVRTQDRRAGLS